MYMNKISIQISPRLAPLQKINRHPRGFIGSQRARARTPKAIAPAPVKMCALTLFERAAPVDLLDFM